MISPSSEERELQTPREAAEEISPTREFSIILDKTNGMPLGINVDSVDRITLLIEAVTTGGLVEKWNLANPEMKIMVNDKIIEVNSKGRGDAAQIVEELKKHEVVTLKIARSTSTGAPARRCEKRLRWL